MRTYRCSTSFIIDRLAEMEARKRRWLDQRIRCSNYSGTWSDLMWAADSDGTAVASTSSETSMLPGLNGSEQPVIPALFFAGANKAKCKSLRWEAAGIFSNTGTPTMTWQLRASTTQGTSTLSGALLGQSKAIATSSGVSNQAWWACVNIVCRTPGVGAGNCTLVCDGWIASPGFSTAGLLPLETSAPDTGTWTQTVDGAQAQWLNWTMTWNANSGSNTATLKRAQLFGLN